MASQVEARIKELGLSLPKPMKPLANYAGYCVSGRLVFISGQLPILEGKLAYKGKVGKTISPEKATVAAKVCTLNVLAQLKKATEEAFRSKAGLDSVLKVVKIEGFVNSSIHFSGQSKVIDGASDLIKDIFGKKGLHSRTAVGASSLPLNAPVEIAAIFEMDF